MRICLGGTPLTSAFIVSQGSAGTPPLAEDLGSVGIAVLGAGDIRTMVQDVVACAPDLVVCFENHPDDAFFAGIAALRDVSPRPVVVFTGDPEAENIERATTSGIHAYVVNGYGLHRLRPVLQLAQARFRYEQSLRGELQDVQHRFSERKLVDRAKGILMRVRNISEDEAYRVLRTTAMSAKQRIGQMARRVIDAARYAESVNRAGQLRMLSQRLVKLYALMCAGVTPEGTAALCRESIERVEQTLQLLGRTLSKPTFGDLIDGVLAPWSALKAALARAPVVADLPEVDRLAERLLLQSEALTRTLEAAGLAAASLHVINVAGRQRMLSQRLAKCAVIAGLVPGDATERSSTEAAFTEALAYLRGIPLTSPEILALLDTAAEAWSRFQPMLTRTEIPSVREEVAVLSESLLVTFDQLTDLYERGMQMLIE